MKNVPDGFRGRWVGGGTPRSSGGINKEVEN